MIIPKRKVWNLKKQSVREIFHAQMRKVEKVNNIVEENILSCGDFFKRILRTADKICSCTKGPARHVATWWWNYRDHRVDRDYLTPESCSLFAEDSSSGEGLLQGTSHFCNFFYGFVQY